MKGNSPEGTSYRSKRISLVLLAFVALAVVHLTYQRGGLSSSPAFTLASRDQAFAQCRNINTPAGPPPSFVPSSRIAVGSDRYVPRTSPTLLRNARIWTGARNGTEIVFGDILLDKGLVIAIGRIPREHLVEAKTNDNLKILDVGGKWITPGLVDLHSHLGVDSSPQLNGNVQGARNVDNQ